MGCSTKNTSIVSSSRICLPEILLYQTERKDRSHVYIDLLNIKYSKSIGIFSIFIHGLFPCFYRNLLHQHIDFFYFSIGKIPSIYFSCIKRIREGNRNEKKELAMLEYESCFRGGFAHLRCCR